MDTTADAAVTKNIILVLHTVEWYMEMVKIYLQTQKWTLIHRCDHE